MNRKKVILSYFDSYEDAPYNLNLTKDQINLLYWLLEEDILNPKAWKVTVISDDAKWVEV